MADTERLKTELETYNRHKEELVSGNEGRYALVHGDEVAGIWDAYEDALKAGYERFGLEPFLVKEIGAVARIPLFGPDVNSCQS